MKTKLPPLPTIVGIFFLLIIAWTFFAAHLVTSLNEHTKGTPDTTVKVERVENGKEN